MYKNQTRFRRQINSKKTKQKKNVMAIVVRAIFYENNKYYPKDFR